MRFLNTILDIIFPSRCISCNKSGADLCIKCLSESPLAERETAKWVFPLYDYRHPSIKKALWLFKYNGKKRLANVFAKVIYDKIMEELSDLSIMENFNNIILIPIPLSSKRHKERGYNQSELICRELIRLSKENHLTSRSSPYQGDEYQSQGEVFTLENKILIKTKEIEHQARIRDKDARLKNISGSFGVKDLEQGLNKIKNRNIILIDDITTTCATLNEARKVLKKSGARKIIAFTVAH